MSSSKRKSASVWSVAQHDTIPSVELWLNPLDTHVYLSAFLRSEGQSFAAPYAAVRSQVEKAVQDLADRKRKGQAPSASVEDSRIRTWKSTFEDFGMLEVDENGRIRLTRLGAALRDVYQQVNARLEGANDHLAKIGVEILNRYTLRNPVDAGEYPEDSDVRPFNFIWRAMRRLDDKLHWQELNRVIMKVVYRKDEDAAIELIRSVRQRVGGQYDDRSAQALGDPAIDEGAETKRRLTVWFTRAGFGGLLVTPLDDEAGYRAIVERHKPLIDDAIDAEVRVPAAALLSRQAYLHYLTESPAISGPSPAAADRAEIDRVVDAAKRFGGSKIICLSGIPGTGKSRLAKLAASQLADGDNYRFEEIQFHEGTSYDDFVEGFVARPSGAGFELVPKVFKVMNRRAGLDPSQHTYVLLVEEFTRCNVHAVLGELITYIEHRDRPFRLTLSQSEMRVSPNLVIMATMNPRDKSALVLDHAILRRLHIIECASSAERLNAMLSGQLSSDLLDQLSRWLSRHLGSLPFGHGVFASARSANDLREIWSGSLRYFLTDLSGAVKPQYQPAVDEFPWK